jgi:integrase/recombinase XerD
MPPRTFCGVLHATGCQISEALALTAQQIDLSGRVVVFESLKKRRLVLQFRYAAAASHA